MSEHTQAVTVDVSFDPTDAPPAEWDWPDLLSADVRIAEISPPEQGSDLAMVQRLTLVVSYHEHEGAPSDWDWTELLDTDVTVVDADEIDDADDEAAGA